MPLSRPLSVPKNTGHYLWLINYDSWYFRWDQPSLETLVSTESFLLGRIWLEMSNRVCNERLDRALDKNFTTLISYPLYLPSESFLTISSPPPIAKAALQFSLHFEIQKAIHECHQKSFKRSQNYDKSFTWSHYVIRNKMTSLWRNDSLLMRLGLYLRKPLYFEYLHLMTVHRLEYRNLK